MDEKREGSGSAASGQRLAAQYSQLLGVKQLSTEFMASTARLNALGESVARTQRTNKEIASSVLKSQEMNSALAANVLRAQGMGESFARTRFLGLEMVSSLASTPQLREQMPGAYTGSFAGIQGLLAETAGMRVLVQGLAVEIAQMTPRIDTSWITTMIKLPGALRAADLLPTTVRGSYMADVFRPLLQTGEYKQFGGAAADLAKWAADGLSGTARNSSEQFANIAKRFADVELDEETEQQYEVVITEDEPALDAVMEFWEISDLSLRNPKNRRALVLLLGFTTLLLVIVGFLGDPVLTRDIIAAIELPWAVGQLSNEILKAKYSPEAEAKLNAMGRWGLRGRNRSR